MMQTFFVSALIYHHGIRIFQSEEHRLKDPEILVHVRGTKIGGDEILSDHKVHVLLIRRHKERGLCREHRALVDLSLDQCLDSLTLERPSAGLNPLQQGKDIGTCDKDLGPVGAMLQHVLQSGRYGGKGMFLLVPVLHLPLLSSAAKKPFRTGLGIPEKEEPSFSAVSTAAETASE